MKKALIGFLAVIGVLFLASCSSGAKEETKTFTMDQNGFQWNWSSLMKAIK